MPTPAKLNGLQIRSVFLFFLFFLFSSSSRLFAQAPEPIVSPLVESAPKFSGASSELRDKIGFSATLIVSPLDMLVPMKKGISLGLVFAGNHVFELEYLSASLSPFLFGDLGTVNDKKISLTYRSFNGRNSFNWLYGLAYLDSSLEFGDKLYNKISGVYPYFEAFKVITLGFQVGFGSEWMFSHYFAMPIRIDWLTLTIPFYMVKKEAEILNYVSDSNTRSDLDKAISIASYIPRLAVLKFQIGFSF